MPAPTIFNPPAVSYDIAIDEEQRLVLATALCRMLKDLEANSSNVPDDWVILLSMLVELPEQEASEPGCLHGFCL